MALWLRSLSRCCVSITTRALAASSMADRTARNNSTSGTSAASATAAATMAMPPPDQTAIPAAATINSAVNARHTMLRAELELSGCGIQEPRVFDQQAQTQN